ncbi:hypothetical protein H632_c912p0 [Helicosporidium sp. ATCC 50920]|nr:hypothetical protein H632_c912p0 [Helicosporidium sp. ATCC 50920]|eukprot:KDD75032.1 hypothetical protein H632_c912p0 [Helicosporidium sp. ATCC 50920]
MGPHRPKGAQGAADERSAHERVVAVVRKAGFRPVLLPRAGAHCCGMLFDTRGFPSAGEGAREALGRALRAASEGGALPVVVDTSPCLETLRRAFPELRQALLDPAEATEQLLAPHLVFEKTKGAVSLHVPCSAKRMGLEPAMRRVAERCAAEVRDSGVPCCGTGGDRGFRFPELSRAALQHLDVEGCQAAYSSSRTCQISLAQAAGMPFDALMTLVDESTQAKRPEL